MRYAPQASESEGDEEEEAPKGRTDAPTRWAKSFGTVVHDVLADTDGVATRLYYYLWRKNAAGRTPTEFRIPDTVRLHSSRLRLRSRAHVLTRSRAAPGGVQVPASRVLVLQLRAERAGAARRGSERMAGPTRRTPCAVA